MAGAEDIRFEATRRGFLSGAVGAGAVAAVTATPSLAAGAQSQARGAAVPFFGPHQAGIATPQQAHVQFAVFDVTTKDRAALRQLFNTWTVTAERLTRGETPSVTDSGEALDLGPSRLTLTFGLGAGLFTKDGQDRFGLAARRPAPLVDLPRFPGDQLIEAKTGGDLCVQACADNRQAAFHAIRTLAREADGMAQLRWVQSGFTASRDGKGGDVGGSPRNLMGFRDGSLNVKANDAAAMTQHVWADPQDASWMKGGSYMVVRPTRIALEHWDRMKLAFQEQTIGRSKRSGAPPGGRREGDPLPLEAVDADGNPLMAENSHARLAAPQTNGGAQLLRRAYSYDNGVSFVAERWPPWRQGMELDAGLLFIAFQRDPRAAFIPMFERMSRFDMLNQFVTPIGAGLFAVPGGVTPGRYLAQDLLEA